jgi:serine/threonine protein kinase
MHGKSLDSVIHQKSVQCLDLLHNRLSFAKKSELLLDVVKGMIYLHGLDPTIIHRDLKPSVCHAL